MFLHHRPVKTVITGKSGSGKTTYFQRLIENGFQTVWKTVFLYDWQGEMSLRLNVQPCLNIDDLPETLKTGFVCFDPQNDFEGDNETGLLFFSRWAFQVCKANDEYPPYPRLFCCDELQLLLDTPNYCPIEIKSIMQTGRRCGLDLAIVAQQLNELNNKIKSQSTERVTFQHEDPLVLDVMLKWGFNPEEVKNLNVGEYLYRNDRGTFLCQKLFSTPDSGRGERELTDETDVDNKESEP